MDQPKLIIVQLSVRPGARERRLSLECCPFHKPLRGKARPRPLQHPTEESNGVLTPGIWKRELRGLTVPVQTEDLEGIGKLKRVEIEVGTAEIKGRESLLLPGWEWVCLQDPWTGEWEWLWVPKEEADYRRWREIPPDHPTGVRPRPESGGGD